MLSNSILNMKIHIGKGGYVAIFTKTQKLKKRNFSEDKSEDVTTLPRLL